MDLGSFSHVRLGLAKPGDAVPRFPLAPFLKNLHSLKALEDISFRARSAGRAQTRVL